MEVELNKHKDYVHSSINTNKTKNKITRNKFSDDSADEGRSNLEQAYDNYIDHQTQVRMREMRQELAAKMTKGYSPEHSNNIQHKYADNFHNDINLQNEYSPDDNANAQVQQIPKEYLDSVQHDNNNDASNSNSPDDINFGDYMKDSAQKRYSSDPELNFEVENMPNSNKIQDEEQSGSDQNDIKEETKHPTFEADPPEESKYDLDNELQLDKNTQQQQMSTETYNNDQEECEGEDENFPILFLDVNLGKDRVERLVIYDGDDPFQVAEEFCKTNGLEPRKQKKLAKVIKKQLDSLLTRIDEDEDEEDSRS